MGCNPCWKSSMLVCANLLYFNYNKSYHTALGKKIHRLTQCTTYTSTQLVIINYLLPLFRLSVVFSPPLAVFSCMPNIRINLFNYLLLKLLLACADMFYMWRHLHNVRCMNLMFFGVHHIELISTATDEEHLTFYSQFRQVRSHLYINKRSTINFLFCSLQLNNALWYKTLLVYQCGPYSVYGRLLYVFYKEAEAVMNSSPILLISHILVLQTHRSSWSYFLSHFIYFRGG